MRNVTRAILWSAVAVFCVAVVRTQGQAQGGLQVAATSIGGTVVNAATGKPEAGVWVIAETKLPNAFRKIVITDDQGRFVAPDLPMASYDLWVRGYGLKDSAKTPAARGATVQLKVADAATPQEAARIYPSSYWISMIQPPAVGELSKEFHGSQDYWLANLRGCNQCHQLGMPTTRILTSEMFDKMFKLNTGMNGAVDRLGRQLVMKTLGDWTTRIKNGQVPPAPPRPTGIERNFVITQWDWGFANSFVHDNVSTDKRNATLYPFGKVYAADRLNGGRLLWLDPVKNTIGALDVEPRDKTKFDPTIDYYHRGSEEAAFGDGTSSWMASPHNPMLDEQGRVCPAATACSWATTTRRRTSSCRLTPPTTRITCRLTGKAACGPTATCSACSTRRSSIRPMWRGPRPAP